MTRPLARTAAIAACGWLFGFVALSAHAAGVVDESLLRLERAQHFYAQMAKAAQIDRPFLEVPEDMPRSAVRAHGIELAASVYSVERALNDARSRMQAVGGSVPAGRLPDIASRMEAIDASVDRKSFEELQAIEAAWTERYRSRADRRKIEAIVNAMAAPTLAGETVVTARRMKWTYETVIVERPGRLKALDAAEFEAGIKTIMARSRGPDHDNQPPLLRRDVMKRMWRERRQVVLAQLAAEDVAELHRVYTSPAARAKTAALKAAFRARNDADGQQFMTRMIGDAATR